ncbi:hypothetical protein AB0M02_29835 [Actinoplanes sp. NPDC051861]|uniref:NACHT domain-containing protein n=1 Tax=Actinoplanes sp. NPDC051861 TaxID=3155170 RepID=UPI0034130824
MRSKARRKAENEIGFKAVRQIVESVSPGGGAVEVVDRLFSAALILSPVALGPAGAIPLLALFDMKNDLVRHAIDIARKLAGTKGDFLDRSRALAAAHWLITYSAFFEALQRFQPLLAAPSTLAQAQNLCFHRKIDSRHLEFHIGPPEGEVGEPDHAALPPVSLPHPASSFEAEAEDRLRLYQQMAHTLSDINRGFGQPIPDLDEAALAQSAVEHYHAQYLQLMLDYRDFFGYAMYYEHQKTQEIAVALSERTTADLGRVHRALHGLDQGLKDLSVALAFLKRTDGHTTDATRVADDLNRYYQHRADEPVVKDDTTGLVFPSRADAYIPQAFKTVVFDHDELRLEQEPTWDEVPERHDLGVFLVHYLGSVHSTQHPLVLLGHPGSGKSLLTQVLAARLIPPAFTTVRIELRDIDPDTDLQEQIEDQIRADTGRDVNWADFAEGLRDEPPLVILDGFDELLQSTGRVHAGYLDRVRRFQEREFVQNRPVRVIITSRITLIDKAPVPLGATVVRLLEFDGVRRQKWASIWNGANREYFARSGVRPFEVPVSERLLELARQPLLLLMLALYDSTGNELAGSGLDRTQLYYNLLERFIRREHDKNATGRRRRAETAAAVAEDMRRLGVVAIGMFNREAVHARRDEIGADLVYFGAERVDGLPTTGALLSQADLLLGSFFFIHQSQGRTGDTGLSSSFEFLHNTFGEFLAAEFIVSALIDCFSVVSAAERSASLQRMLDDHLAGPGDHWFATFAFAALHGRPVIVDMIRSRLPQRISVDGVTPAAVAAAVHRVIDRQLLDIATRRPSAWFLDGIETAPYPKLSLVGQLAVYTLNLVVVGAAVTPAGYSVPGHVWNVLSGLWRAGFTTDGLREAAAVLWIRDQDETTVTVSSRPRFVTPGSRSPLETHAIAAELLGDNLTSGASRLALAELHHLESADLEMARVGLAEGGVPADDLIDMLVRKVADRRLRLPASSLLRFRHPMRRQLRGADLEALEILDAERGSEDAAEAVGPLAPEDLDTLLTMPSYHVRRLISAKAQLGPAVLDSLAGAMADTRDPASLPMVADVLRHARAHLRRDGVNSLERHLTLNYASESQADVAAELLILTYGEHRRTIVDTMFAESFSDFGDLSCLPEDSLVRLLVMLADPSYAPASTARMKQVVAARLEAAGDDDLSRALVLATFLFLDLRREDRFRGRGHDFSLTHFLGLLRAAHLRGDRAMITHVMGDESRLGHAGSMSTLNRLLGASSIADLEDRLTARQLADVKWFLNQR